MKTAIHEENACSRWPARFWIIGLALLLFVMIPAAALAELGGDVSTVPADQAHMKAGLRVTAGARYNVHELSAPSGTVVREYASPEGKVFAVAWQGPWFPDLRQLLGSYFQQYSQAARSRRARGAPLNIVEPGLVVQFGGHMRAFFGRAYVPGMVPSGVTAEEIR